MILVTGAAGFIGMQLSKRLLEEGEEVVGVDDVNNYYDPQLKEARIRELEKENLFTFRRMEFVDLDKEDLKDVTYVFHEAAHAGVRASVENPLLYEKVNCHDTVKLMKNCVDAGVEKFIFASTSSVYGKVFQFPTPETHPTNPISPYGASKLAVEKYLTAFHECYGFPSVALRYFTVYGPWGRPDMLIMKAINNCLGKGKLLLFKKDGKTVDFSRDFSYVSDVVEANVLAMKSKIKHDIFNVGSGSEVKVEYIIDTVSKIIGKGPKLEEMEANPADPLRSLADLKKTNKALGFVPKTGVEEGIGKAIEWYNKYYQ